MLALLPVPSLFLCCMFEYICVYIQFEYIKHNVHSEIYTDTFATFYTIILYQNDIYTKSMTEKDGKYSLFLKYCIL